MVALAVLVLAALAELLELIRHIIAEPLEVTHRLEHFREQLLLMAAVLAHPIMVRLPLLVGLADLVAAAGLCQLLEPIAPEALELLDKEIRAAMV